MSTIRQYIEVPKTLKNSISNFNILPHLGKFIHSSGYGHWTLAFRPVVYLASRGGGNLHYTCRCNWSVHATLNACLSLFNFRRSHVLV